LEIEFTLRKPLVNQPPLEISPLSQRCRFVQIPAAAYLLNTQINFMGLFSTVHAPVVGT